MSQLSALRLYFPLSAKAKPTRLWHRFVAPSLASHLLDQASQAGIQQVVMHKVTAGYLPGDRLQQHVSDTPPNRLPQCLELIDQEGRLRAFLQVHSDHLAEVRVVLHPCTALI